MTEVENAKYVRGTDENTAFLEHETNELLNFGVHFPYKDGGSTWLDEHGEPDPSQGVQTWITCRMAHVYALGALHGGHPSSEGLVDAALKGLTGILHDDVNGGWYPQINADGTPAPGKICYTHAFVILAATSATYIGRPGAQKLLAEALKTFDDHFWDEETGLAVDTWNTEFTELDPYRGINANMHTTEAFLAVADVTGNEEYRKRAGRIIDHVVGWAHDNGYRLPEHFTADWKVNLEYNADHKDDQFKPYGATPGHGIEWARLITQWALSTYPDDEDARKPYIDTAEKLFAQAVEDAWAADGQPGLVYTTDWQGQPVVHDRMHWTLAEGVNTAATLGTVTGKTHYDDWYARFCQYIDEYLIDHEGGSWFHQLDRDNKVIGTVWPGKSDLYHALQSTLIPRLDPSLSVVPALGKTKKVEK